MGEKRAVQVSHELWKQMMTRGYTSAGIRCVQGLPDGAQFVSAFHAFVSSQHRYPDLLFVFESSDWGEDPLDRTVSYGHERLPLMAAPVFQIAECRTCKQSEADPALISLGSAQASHLCLWLDKYFKPDFSCAKYQHRETND